MTNDSMSCFSFFLISLGLPKITFTNTVIEGGEGMVALPSLNFIADSDADPRSLFDSNMI
jgi:hypothetical protein